MKGRIPLNKKTENHADVLRTLGYPVEIVDGSIKIECTGFSTDPVQLTDLETASAYFKGLARERKLATYGTPFLLPGREKPLFGIPAIRKLSVAGSLRDALGYDPTALIVQGPRVSKSSVTYPENVTSRKEKRQYLADKLGIKPDGLSLKVLRKQLAARKETPEPQVSLEEVESLDQALQALRAKVESQTVKV